MQCIRARMCQEVGDTAKCSGMQQNAAECCKMQLQNHFQGRTLTGRLRLSQTSLLARTQTKHAGERGGFQGISFGVGGD
jgi:hypothetical protein